jgi:hypothetical protein
MANFQYNPPFPAVVTGDKSTFTRTYAHRNWVDGQDVVQAGETPDEAGMNARLNALEVDLDAVKADLVQSYKLIADLRQALAVALSQVQGELNRKTDKAKEGKDAKDGKETKETKDSKDGKETKEAKDGKETKETKEHKDGKETKETKEVKDGLNAIEKRLDNLQPATPIELMAPDASDAGGEAGRAFIRSHERPPVGDRILRDSPPASPAP